MNIPSKMSVVAIIPAHNEQERIGEVVEQTRLFVDRVLVVDDGSIDNTTENAKSAGAEVLTYTENKGKGFALRRGVNHVLEKYSPEYLVFLDADREHNPVDIPKFMAKLGEKDVDLVVGTRFKKNSWARSKTREILNKFTGFFMKIATGYSLSDTNCGFRAMTQRYLTTVTLNEDGFEIDLEMILEARKHNLRVSEIDVSKPENYAKSGFSIKHMIQMNNFFDIWVIKNHGHLNTSLANKIFILTSSYAGLLLFQNILWLIWIRQKQS